MQQKLNNKTLTHKDMVQIDKLDNTLTRWMLQADKNLNETHIKILWSIELSNCIKNISYWQLVVSQLLTKVSRAVRLSKLVQHLHLSYAIVVSTVTNTYTKRLNARKEIRKTIAQSCKFWRQHFIARTIALNSTVNTKKGKLLNNTSALRINAL